MNGLETNNIAQADKLFDKISQNSNIEWDYFKFEHRFNEAVPDFAVMGNTSTCFNGEDYLSVMFLESYLDKHGSNLMKSSYSISMHEHNHPGGGPPSGYSRSGVVDFDMLIQGRGDAAFSESFSKRPISSSGIKFYVNPQGANFKYEYKGTNDFKKINK